MSTLLERLNGHHGEVHLLGIRELHRHRAAEREVIVR